MIVDFTSIKFKLDRIAHSHLKFVLKREEGFLGQMRLHIFHEGHGEYSFQTVDNETIEQEDELIESSFGIPNEKLKDLKLHEVLQLIENLGVEMAKKRAEMAIKRMNEAIDRVGNVVVGENKSFAENSLAMLEKVQIDFDESRDKPSLPTILVHPSTAEKLKAEEKSMSIEDKLSYEQKQEEILNRKYEEYVLRESNRKLVD